MSTRSDRGFTMVEMMFALLILSIVLLGLVSVLGSVVRYQVDGRSADKVGIAINQLFGQAGQALSEHFDRPLVPDVFAAGQQTLYSLEGVKYSISETRERDDLVRVDLTLTWNDKSGAEHKKQVSTKFLRSR